MLDSTSFNLYIEFDRNWIKYNDYSYRTNVQQEVLINKQIYVYGCILMIIPINVLNENKFYPLISLDQQLKTNIKLIDIAWSSYIFRFRCTLWSWIKGIFGVKKGYAH